MVTSVQLGTRWHPFKIASGEESPRTSAALFHGASHSSTDTNTFNVCALLGNTQ